MTDRLRLQWPDPAPFVDRDDRPIRILAISDEPDPSLESQATRSGLGPIDLILYRPILMWAGMVGTVQFLRGHKGWDKFERNVRRPAPSAVPA